MKRSMKRSLSSKDLIDFILAAKIAKCNKECTWSLSHRPGSIDLQFARPSAGLVYSYSGFGHSESISQEVIYSSSDEAIWAMNQYIHIHESDDRSKINELTQEFSLKQYQQGRLLGSFNHSIKDYTYADDNNNNFFVLSGRWFIKLKDEIICECFYHGGLLIERWELQDQKRPSLKISRGT